MILRISSGTHFRQDSKSTRFRTGTPNTFPSNLVIFRFLSYTLCASRKLFTLFNYSSLHPNAPTFFDSRTISTHASSASFFSFTSLNARLHCVCLRSIKHAALERSVAGQAHRKEALKCGIQKNTPPPPSR